MKKVIYGLICGIAAISAFVNGCQIFKCEKELDSYNRRRNSIVLHEVQEINFVCDDLIHLYDSNNVEHTIMIDWTHDVAG